jgi:hypothetical protein
MPSSIISGVDTDKVRENRLRRLAQRHGLSLQKAKRRDPYSWDYGTYRLVSPESKNIVFANLAVGNGYGLSLDDVEDYLDDLRDRRPTFSEAEIRRSLAKFFIPKGPWPQGRWKAGVLIRYANFGLPMRQAVAESTADEKALDPTFEPEFKPGLLNLLP